MRLRILIVAVALLCSQASTAVVHAAQDQRGIKKLVYTAGGAEFPYVVYTPPGRARGRAMPLVVMTHGCQTTAEEQMNSTLFNRVAKRNGFVVLYPDIDVTGTQQPGPLRNCWRFFDSNSWHRDQGDAAAIAGMTRAVIASEHVDPERVYLVGMPAGAFMTSIIAAAYPDVFAAVAINAGGAYADATCLLGNLGRPVAESAALAFAEMGSRARVVPRLVMGGDADLGIPPACADKALEQGLRTNNLVIDNVQETPISLTPTSVRTATARGRYDSTVSTYTDAAGCVVGQRWTIHGMNHFWPGGSRDPALASFTDPNAPNGARIAWGFLRRYTKESTAMQCAEIRASRDRSAAGR